MIIKRNNIKKEELSEETKQRLSILQSIFDEMQIRNFGLTLNYENKPEDYEKFVNDVCFMIESYLNGNYTIIETFEESTQKVEND